MLRKIFVLCLLGFSASIWHCTQDKSGDLRLRDNMIFRKSATIDSSIYHYYRLDSLKGPVVYIEGAHLDIDFNQSSLLGNPDPTRPDKFLGNAVIIENSHHVTIRNLKVSGYKVAILAKDVAHLKLINCDLSYNFRQQLGSIREREDLSDWLYYHENENDEWLRYGSAVYLKNCDHAIIKDLSIMQGQNGLLMVQCDSGLIYNNNFQFNSGLGIGMYRSSDNRIMHNRVDFNVRGYSHGVYKRGQDSAGILLYEQCKNNIIAYNSATHSGDGLFLWAGNQTMNTGIGGCNHNIIYKNDFSFAPANGIEVTFSQNLLIENIMKECRYGIWGGYSHHSLMKRNFIEDCEFGIAIEHGQHNNIIENTISNTNTGIQLWERMTQPTNWGFAKKRNTSSSHYRIIGNHFINVRTPTDIKQTSAITISENTDNGMSVNPDISSETVNKNFEKIDKSEYALPARLVNGIIPKTIKENLDGRKYIIVNEWGPYNYSYPLIWLREINQDKYIFALFGPEGNWRVTNSEGFNRLSLKSGSFPNSIVGTGIAKEGLKKLDLEFIGESFTDQFGNNYNRGQVYPFSFTKLEDPLLWDIYFYEYKVGLLPLSDLTSYKDIISGNPLAHIQSDELAFTWWSAPHEKISEDHFISISKAGGDFVAGNYKLRLISDDGARLFIDKKLWINDWSIHTPQRKIITIKLDGHHDFKIEHFDEGGLANLDFRIEKILD